MANEGDEATSAPPDDGPSTTVILTPAAEADGRAPALARGTLVGRYVVLETVGEGGMGTLYRAFDPQLERTVALKLLRARAQARESNATAQGRLLREAKALARLSHPNVVAVYEAGTFGGEVFIAMEFVEGETLRQWLHHERRPQARILEVLLAAGEGLAAAHRSGLVHRDFKPDNVLVGRNGSVKVVDFGLAREQSLDTEDTTEGAATPLALTADPPLPERFGTSSLSSSGSSSTGTSSAGTSSLGSLSAPLTEAGAILGTPRYMAPEQYLREPVDGRADQFAFCITLHEALYRESPFGKGTVAELRGRILAGKRVPPPRDVRVPAWIRSVLHKGLAPRPADRYPTMAALLEALRRDPWSKLAQRLRWGLVLGAVVSSAALWLHTRQRLTQVCRGAEDKLAGAWDEVRREDVRRAFRQSGAPDPEGTFEVVSRAFDEYARSWAAMFTEACESTRVRGEQSEELLDLRMGCLAERREALAALTRVFAEADATLVQKAAQAARQLPALDTCADTGVLRATVRPPTDAAGRARLEQVRSLVAKANAEDLTGRLDLAAATARSAVEVATALDYAPALGEALLIRGRIENHGAHYAPAIESIHAAAVAASTGRDEELQARAWLSLAFLVGAEQERPAEGRVWLRYASAIVSRLERKETLLGTLLRTESVLLWREGHLAEAEATARKAIPVLEAALGPDHPRLGWMHADLASILGDLRRRKEAAEHHRAAIDIWRRGLGPNNTSTATTLCNLASDLIDDTHYEEALGHLQEAQHVVEAVRGGELPIVGFVFLGKARALLHLGDLEGAERAAEGAHAFWMRTHGGEHPLTALALGVLAETALARHDLPRAKELAQASLRGFARQADGEQPSAIGVHVTLGHVAMGEGHPGDAFERYDKALTLSEHVFGKDDATAAPALLGLGQWALATGRPHEAVPFFTRALAIREAQAGDLGELADARFALATALAAADEDPARARALAEAAAHAYESQGIRAAKRRGEVAVWLAKHP